MTDAKRCCKCESIDEVLTVSAGTGYCSPCWIQAARLCIQGISDKFLAEYLSKAPSEMITENDEDVIRKMKRRARERVKARAIHLKSKYGMTPADYTRLLEAQDHACKICRRKESALDHRSGQPRELAVDHCHTTGAVRGLLCGACNKAIGLMKDDRGRLTNAIKYLDSAKALPRKAY